MSTKFQGHVIFATWDFPKNLNWLDTYLVLVNGSTPCGHMLLYVGGGFGHYFHYNGPGQTNWPRYMAGENEYRRYLKEANYIEVMRKYISISNPKKAEEKLKALAQRQWSTFLIKHNCATFAEEVVKAGGASWGIYEGCPVFGVFIKMLKDGEIK